MLKYEIKFELQTTVVSEIADYVHEKKPLFKAIRMNDIIIVTKTTTKTFHVTDKRFEDLQAQSTFQEVLLRDIQKLNIVITSLNHKI